MPRIFPIVFMYLFAFLCLLHAQRMSKPFDDDNSKYTTTGNIGLTILNYGTFGDGCVRQSPVDQPSCECPKGSGSLEFNKPKGIAATPIAEIDQVVYVADTGNNRIVRFKLSTD